MKKVILILILSERMITDNFYIGIRAFYHLTFLFWEASANMLWDTFGIDIIARWNLPINNTLFAEIGLGYGSVDNTSLDSVSGVIISPVFRKRFNLNIFGDFFDLMLCVPVVLGVKEDSSGKTEFGWGINLRPVFTIGLSF